MNNNYNKRCMVIIMVWWMTVISALASRIMNKLIVSNGVEIGIEAEMAVILIDQTRLVQFIGVRRGIQCGK